MILVTGTTGRIRFRLMEALRDAGAGATAMVRVEARADLPEAEARRRLLDAGLTAWQADGVLELQAWIRDGGAVPPAGDVRELTGREPRPVEHWLEEFRAGFPDPL